MNIYLCLVRFRGHVPVVAHFLGAVLESVVRLDSGEPVQLTDYERRRVENARGA